MTTDPLQQRPAEPEPPRAQKSSKKPWLLALVLLVIGLAAVGGVAGIILYDQATKPDRSDPTVTVQQFLTAVFVEKDPTRVGLFVCSDLAPESAIARAHDAVDAEATASWDMVVVDRRDGEQAQVSVRLMTTYPGELAPSGQRQWTFQLVDADGWRVCSFDWAA